MKKPRIVPVSIIFLTGVTYPSLQNYLQKWRYNPKRGYKEYVFITKMGKRYR